MTEPIKIIVKSSGDIKIHTFISSYEDNNIANATHIIESKNILVIIDGQFLTPFAKEFRAYADSINKPIDRLYISHRHPDHWFGVCDAFDDVALYTLSETLNFIQEHGEESRKDHIPKLGADLVPKKVVVPENIVMPGVEIIDGVTYVFDRIVDTEIDYLLTIKLPELKTYIVQDLIYSGTHLYLTKDMDHWIQVLSEMLVSDYDLFLAGHGLPADKNEVVENVKYLTAAKKAISQGKKNDTFKDFMLTRFPSRECPGIFDIYIPRLFDGASPF